MKFLHVQSLAAVIVAAVFSTSVLAREMITEQAIKTQCQNMVSCNLGGVEGNSCTIATQACPVCVTFDNNGCFAIVSGKCNFGYDCTTAWESSTTAASSASSGTGGTATSSGSKTNSDTTDSAGVATNSSSNSTASPSTSSDSTTSSASSGTDMTVVFGIVGAAIGVIAVAVIFLALVRRSRASDDDDEELANTPPAMAKAMPGGPSTATHAASYAPYAARAPSNPTTPTNRVIKYYNDNAMPSPHGSRGASGFNQPSQQPQVKTVRPAAAANAPTFFKANQPASAPPARAVPMPVTAPASQPYAAYEAQQYYGQPAPAAQYAANEPLFTVHTGSEEPPQVVRRVSSPRTRRESYEF